MSNRNLVVDSRSIIAKMRPFMSALMTFLLESANGESPLGRGTEVIG